MKLKNMMLAVLLTGTIAHINAMKYSSSRAEQDTQVNKLNILEESDDDQSFRFNQKYENNLVKTIQNTPALSMWGGIDYTMTLNQMKETVKAVFENMKHDGLIISTDEFESIKAQYFTDKPSNNLSRIWGADYLSQKINKSERLRTTYSVPKYIIVADNPHKIAVMFWLGNTNFPAVTALTNSLIYFEKIKGEGRALAGSVRELSEIGYTDFSDIGNIIEQEKTLKNYIVDTEFKSFNIIVNLKPQLLEYIHERFHHLNPTIGFACRYEFDLP